MLQAQQLPHSLAELRAVVSALCAERPIARMELFGSAARGRARADSDIDLLVEFLPDAQTGLLEMGELKEDLEDRLGCRVDLLSRRAVEKSRNPYRRQAILTNPVTLYAR